MRWYWLKKAFFRRRRTKRSLSDLDACVVSYPKTGRTWLRMMLGKYLCVRYGLNESAILDTPALCESAGLPVTDFVHAGSALSKRNPFHPESCKASDFSSLNVLLLTRSAEDALVSAYFQVTKRLCVYSGSISEFLRHEFYGVDRFLSFYRHWEQIQHVPRGFNALSYESMHDDPESALRRTLEQIGVPDIDTAAVRAAVSFCAFENMQRLEKSKAFAANAMRSIDPANPESRKVRRGCVGGYKDYLNASDLEYIHQRVAMNPGCFVTTLSTPEVADVHANQEAAA